MGDLLQFRLNKSRDLLKELRPGKIKITGIPYLWRTNLTDEEIIDLYHFLWRNKYFIHEYLQHEPDPEKSEAKSHLLSHRLMMEQNKIELHDGRLVQVFHMGDQVMALAATPAQWETLVKKLAEKSLKEEMERECYWELNQYTKMLIRKAKDELNKKKYKAAEALFRHALEVKWKNRPHVKIDVEKELIILYYQTRNLDAGLALLEETYANSDNETSTSDFHWLLFGVQFENSSHCLLAEQVYRATMGRFPWKAGAYKRLVLLLERSGRFEDAIEVCRLAIKRNIEDNTKTGFQGRIRRIRDKMKHNK